VLLGSSGAGKSTLLNRLLGADHARTGAVRADGRGRHTSTHRELVCLTSGALLIDTPGLREIQLWASESGIEASFADVTALARECRFGDCQHGAEPGCAVKSAIDRGLLDAGRLASWNAQRRELRHLERRLDESAARAERQRTKSMQRALRTHLRRKYDG
jgi:ribosome biogenesis GTPase